MRYLAPAAVRQALPMADAIEAMRDAFSDDIEVPQRVLLANSLFMPGRVGERTGIKVVSTVPGNPVGIVVVFDEVGGAVGMLDGPTLTAIRTGAGAGLATDLLAPPDASTLAMLGAGAMAFDQVEAVRTVRPIERILVWSRTPERARALADRVEGEAVDDPFDAVHAADVVSTATPAREPLFPAEILRTGAHVNAVGAFTPEMAEIPAGVVGDAFVVVDDRGAAAVEAGDLIRAGREPDATVGDLLAGRVEAPAGRTTFFKSVGIASQDVAAGLAALLRADAEDLGIRL